MPGLKKDLVELRLPIKEGRPRYSGVNEHARDARKSNKAFCLMGQMAESHLQFGTTNPHCLLSFTLLFFYFYLLNLILI